MTFRRIAPLLCALLAYGAPADAQPVSKGESKPDEVTRGKKMPDQVTRGKKMPDQVSTGEKMPDQVSTGEKMPDQVSTGQEIPRLVGGQDNVVTGALGFPTITYLPRGSPRPLRVSFTKNVTTLSDEATRLTATVPAILANYPHAQIVVTSEIPRDIEARKRGAEDKVYKARRAAILAKLQNYEIAQKRLRQAYDANAATLAIVISE